MELPVLESFCGIFELKSGCVFMGSLNTILSLAVALILITFAVDLKQYIVDNAGKEDGMSSVIYTIVVLLIVLLIIKFLLDILLVFAAIKGLRFVLTHYCIFWIVFVILYSIGFLKIIFHMEPGFAIIQFLFLAENFFYIIVIRSYLMSIEQE